MEAADVSSDVGGPPRELLGLRNERLQLCHLGAPELQQPLRPHHKFTARKAWLLSGCSQRACAQCKCMRCWRCTLLAAATQQSPRPADLKADVCLFSMDCTMVWPESLLSGGLQVPEQVLHADFLVHVSCLRTADRCLGGPGGAAQGRRKGGGRASSAQSHASARSETACPCSGE